jgi:hypothetical protein
MATPTCSQDDGGGSTAPVHGFMIHSTQLQMKVLNAQCGGEQDKKLVFCSTSTPGSSGHVMLWADNGDLIRYVLNGLVANPKRAKAAEGRVYYVLRSSQAPSIMVPTTQLNEYLRACYQSLVPRGSTKVKLYPCADVLAVCQAELYGFISSDMEGGAQTAQQRFTDWKTQFNTVSGICHFPFIQHATHVLLCGLGHCITLWQHATWPSSSMACLLLWLCVPTLVMTFNTTLYPLS